MTRTVAYFVLPTLVLSLGAIAGLRACDYVEHPERTYATYEEAVAADALEPRGWIPAWLPATAYDIREKHAIDSMTRCIRFAMPQADSLRLSAVLTPIESAALDAVDTRCWLGVAWWFEDLIQQAPYNDHALNAEIYRATDDDLNPVFVAIDRTTSLVYVWSR